MGVFTDIFAAMSGHLMTMPSLPDVAWNNAKFDDHTPGVEYLAEFLLPADTEQAGRGRDGIVEDIGTYQVNINTPKAIGKARAFELADLIANHFPTKTSITYNTLSIRVTSVSIGTPQTEGLYYMVPVKIRYQTFNPPR